MLLTICSHRSSVKTALKKKTIVVVIIGSKLNSLPEEMVQGICSHAQVAWPACHGVCLAAACRPKEQHAHVVAFHHAVHKASGLIEDLLLTLSLAPRQNKMYGSWLRQA